MSARKIKPTPDADQPLTINSRQTALTLSPEAVSIHKSGIEFFSECAFPQWVEMTVTLKSPQGGKTVNCVGVVVDCIGNKHAGYHVSMLFTTLSPQAEAQLRHLAYARPN